MSKMMFMKDADGRYLPSFLPLALGATFIRHQVRLLDYVLNCLSSQLDKWQSKLFRALRY